MKCLTPASIGSMQLKNRFLFPSMCNFYCDDEGVVTPRLEAYVRARVQGGAAAVIMPGSPHGKPGPARPALSDPRYASGWRRLLDICREKGCRLIVQIHPAKAQAGRDPSVLLPDNMPREKIRQIVSSYAACARAAREIGLDGAEIHGAHAHEVAQFLSPYYNHRTDEYGGSVERRAALAVEVIRAIKREAGADFPLIFRISGREMIPGGREIEETVEVARILEAAGADALHVSIGMPQSEEYISAPMDVPDGFNVENAARVRAAVKIPVIAVDRINTPELAERVIKQGAADFVAVGRGMLADPEFVNKAAEGKPVRMCLGCNQGCRKSPAKKAIYCAQNPFTGREAAWNLVPDGGGRRVLIAGAGVAGLEAAVDLARRGACVEVWEKRPHAGGLMELACIPPHKDAMNRMISWRMEELRRLGVRVLYGREVTPADVMERKPDLLIVATGSEPAVPPLPGVDHAHVLTADRALTMLRDGRQEELGRCCAVLGGGLVGLETADALCARGIRPDLFERAERIGEGLPSSRRKFVMSRLEAGGCGLHAQTQVKEIRFPYIVTEQDGVQRDSGPYDTVILALGRKRVDGLAKALAGACPGVQVVCLGDAQQPGTAMEAVAQAAQFASISFAKPVQV